MPEQLPDPVRQPPDGDQEETIHQSPVGRELYQSAGRGAFRRRGVLQGGEDVRCEQSNAMAGVQETGLPGQPTELEVKGEAGSEFLAAASPGRPAGQLAESYANGTSHYPPQYTQYPQHAYHADHPQPSHDAQRLHRQQAHGLRVAQHHDANQSARR